MARREKDSITVRRRKRRRGTLTDLQTTLWHALVVAEEVLTRAECDERRLRAAHCIAQCAGSNSRRDLKCLNFNALHFELSQR